VFEKALTDTLTRLDAARAQGLLSAYVLIGGFAVAAWGVPRATQDIDFAVAVGTQDPKALATFMGGRYDAGGVDDPLKGVIRASVTIDAGSIPLQLIMLPAAFTDAIFQHVEMLSILNHQVPVVTWEMLVLLKVYAGGPQDVLDVRQILKVRLPSENELSKVAVLAEQLGIRKEWMAVSADPSREI
jgi:hypothetical protein